jgi:hypothetical protein
MPVSRVPVGGISEEAVAMSLLGVYRRKFAFEAVPAGAKGLRSVGSVITLTPPQATFDTGVGVNKVCELIEDISLDPLEDSNAGESFFTAHKHIIRSVFRRTSVVNPAGECFIGIELGSMGNAPPWQSTFGASNASIQLRYDYTNERWEIMLYDGDGVAPTRQTCTIQPSFSFTPQAREPMIIFDPQNSLIEFYVDAQLIHTYRGNRWLNNPNANYTASGTGGGGLFVTSGSNAAGQITGIFSLHEFIALGQRKFAP